MAQVAIRAKRSLGLMAVFGVVSAPLGWFATDALERDDAFCIACHLDAETPLHIANFDDFRADPAVSSLASAHGAAEEAGRAFRCIDCHGGTGLIGKARVKLLSAKDAFWYVTGRFDEPEGMHWPLLDEDCARCHGSYEPGEGVDPGFHEILVHNSELGVSCVECHLSHERGALVDYDYLHPVHVRSQCARCHPEYEEENG